MEVEKTGYNINQLTDINKVGEDFINYFYNNWKINPTQMEFDNIIKKCTNFQYKGVKYNYSELIEFMNQSKKRLVNIEVLNKEILQSGSRRLDICVTGVFRFNELNLNFCQYFLIVSEPKSPTSWFLQNSILNEIY